MIHRWCGYLTGRSIGDRGPSEASRTVDPSRLLDYQEKAQEHSDGGDRYRQLLDGASVRGFLYGRGRRVEIVGPVEPKDGRFSEFALRLRDSAAAGLRSTRYFSTKLEIEDVRLDGPPAEPSLVILLRTEDHPESIYGLRAKVSEYDAAKDDPEGWARDIHDRVVEAVDAAPGLQAPEGPVTWVDL